MDYFLVFAFGFIMGWFALSRLVKHRVRKIRELLDKSDAESASNEVMVKFTRIDDQVYAYNAETEEFLSQGTTKKEIVDALAKRFPGISFRASPANLKEVNLE